MAVAGGGGFQGIGDGVLLLVSWSLAHGARFGVSALSVAPDDVAAWWGVASGWGVVHTQDAGASWTWVCDEALGTSAIYDVEAVSAAQALVATEAGLLLVGTDCSVRTVPGLEDGYPAFVLPDGAGAWWVSAYTSARDGLFRCSPDACVDGPVGGDGVYVKSAVVDGSVLWVTTVSATDLSASLQRVDGDVATVVATWPDGTVDPRVLAADGSQLLVWAQGRDSDHPPALLSSEDGGVTFTTVLSIGVYTDPVPALLDDRAAGVYYLGTDAGRTFFSSDGGRHFSDVTATAPVVRCSATVGAARIYCADHYADGYDVGTWQFGRPFGGAGCLDDALPPACADACAPYLAPFQEAGLYGGEACYPTVVDAVSTGCGDASRGWLLLGPFAAFVIRVRSRRPQSLS